MSGLVVVLLGWGCCVMGVNLRVAGPRMAYRFAGTIGGIGVGLIVGGLLLMGVQP